MAPLGLDPVSLAGLQAQRLLDTRHGDRARLRRGRVAQPRATRSTIRTRRSRATSSVDDAADGALLVGAAAQPRPAADLRRRRGRDPRARATGPASSPTNPVWIRGIDHRIESHHPGLRDLTASPSTETAAREAGVADGPVDVAELMANYSPEEIVLREALGLERLDGASTRRAGRWRRIR